jgi:hypothetical protein
VAQEGREIISPLSLCVPLFVAFVMLHFTRLSNAQSQFVYEFHKHKFLPLLSFPTAICMWLHYPFYRVQSENASGMRQLFGVV